MKVEPKNLTALIEETKQEIEDLKQRLKSLSNAPETREATLKAIELLEAFVNDLQQTSDQRV